MVAAKKQGFRRIFSIKVVIGMNKKQTALRAVEILKTVYPQGVCSLTYTDALQLLIATRLSA